jgi:ABC-2 type transport system permease protein
VLGDLNAELIKLVRRPANWLLLVVALVLSQLFTYVIPYAGYKGGTTATVANQGLAAILPDRLVGNSIAGLPVFMGGIMVIVGVLAVGGEYGWETWKTVLTQGPSRLAVYAGKIGALALAALVFVLTMFLSGTGSTLLIAAAEHRSLALPSAGDLLLGVGAGWLMAAVWTAFGVLLAVLLRGVALAVGLGLVWLLAVQNLITLLAAPLLGWVDQAQKGLPGPNAGALAGALGSAPDTPGVNDLVGGGQAALVLALYLVGFLAVGGALLRRRDIV